MVKRLQVAIDCADPERLAAFWASVLGYVVDTPPGGYARWHDFSRAVGGTDESWSAVVDPAGTGLRALFHRVPEPKAARIVCILTCGSARPVKCRPKRGGAGVARLGTLGGIHLGTEQDAYHCFAVMADPEVLHQLSMAPIDDLGLASTPSPPTASESARQASSA